MCIIIVWQLFAFFDVSRPFLSQKIYQKWFLNHVSSTSIMIFQWCPSRIFKWRLLLFVHITVKTSPIPDHGRDSDVYLLIFKENIFMDFPSFYLPFNVLPLKPQYYSLYQKTTNQRFLLRNKWMNLNKYGKFQISWLSWCPIFSDLINHDSA